MHNPQRGIVEIRNLGGQTRHLRYRSHELAVLDRALIKVCGKSTIKCIRDEDIGFDFLLQAIIVGVAYSMIGKKGKQAQITEQKIASWVDVYPGGFFELQALVVGAILDGIPGGREAMDAVESVDEEGEDGQDQNPFDVEQAKQPAPSNGSTGIAPLSTLPDAASAPVNSGDSPTT